MVGQGRVDGRVVYAFAQDFTVFGGSLPETNAAKIVKIMDLAIKMGSPVVGLNDSGGARSEKACSRSAATPTSFSATRSRVRRHPADLRHHGAVCRWRGVFPAITDFNIMVDGTSYMSVTGPDVIKTVTHEEVTKEEPAER